MTNNDVADFSSLVSSVGFMASVPIIGWIGAAASIGFSLLGFNDQKKYQESVFRYYKAMYQAQGEQKKVEMMDEADAINRVQIGQEAMSGASLSSESFQAITLKTLDQLHRAEQNVDINTSLNILGVNIRKQEGKTSLFQNIYPYMSQGISYAAQRSLLDQYKKGRK